MDRAAAAADAASAVSPRVLPVRACRRDEISVTNKMVRLSGRSRRGDRLHAAAPFGHWVTQTFIAGLRCDGLVAP